MRMKAGFLAALIGCTLAACSGGNGSDASKPEKTADAGSGSSSGMPGTWKATDACSILDKAAVAEILKQEVTAAQLGLVHEPGAADAGTSECTYAGKDGGTIASIMTRWSPIKDNTADAIAAARAGAAQTMKAFSSKPIEDVPGLGIAAYYAPGIDQINVYLDDSRLIMVTANKVPDGASGKDTAIALAKKAGA